MTTANSSIAISECMNEFVKAARQAPAIYFAPLRGAVLGVMGQWRKTHSTGRRISTPKVA